jgi:hypothetical protein
LLLSACGRLGFSTEDVANASALPDGDDPSEESASAPDGDAPDSDDEGGDDESPPRDASGPEDVSDAATGPALDGGLAPAADASDDTPPSLDSGIETPDAATGDADAGKRGPGRLDCGEHAPNTTLACAAFDHGLPDRSSTRTNDGTIQVEQERLHASTFQREGAAALDLRFAAQQAGTLYLSSWLKIPNDFELSAINVVGLQASSGNDPAVDINVLAPGLFEVFAAQSKTVERAADFVVPRGEWLCLKARILLSSLEGEIELSIDGSPLLAVRNADTLPSVGVDQLSVGLDWTGAEQGTARVQFDNVLLSTREILGDCP